MVQPTLKTTSIAFALAVLFSASHTHAADIYAPWLTQIGLNGTILSNAKWGYGVKLGIVDSGVANSNYFFSKGQLSNKLSSCAAVSFTCTNNFYDDNGHGTAVAAVAAGNKLLTSFSSVQGYTTLANSVMSVAPSSNIISLKVLNQDGEGEWLDVANGIRKAADAGAAVINVSITYGNSAEEVAAINYATSKGAFIVNSGGNDNTTLLGGADTVGLTPEAIKRYLLAGSLNYANVKSSFSNTPGEGSLVANGIKTPYKFRWVMAPGDGVLAPDVVKGSPIDWTYWDGTSFSAPIVSASLGLLINTWPILKKEGTAADLMLATTKNLGLTGVDAVYGMGLLDLSKAFQPYGDVTMKGAKGKTYIASELSGTLLTSGALGKLSKIKSKLKKYDGFDEFNRNFKYNLSGMVTSARARPVVNPLPTFKKKKAKALKFSDGSLLSSWQADTENDVSHLGEFGYNADNDFSQQASYFALETEHGDSISFGYDYPAEIAFQQMLYGQEETADLVSHFSNDMTGIAEGGKLFAFGFQLSPKTRFGLTWNSSLNDIQPNALNQINQASNLKFGLSHQLNEKLSAGLSFGALDEKNGLLGSHYQNNSLLSFNSKNESYSLDLSAIYKLNRNSRLLFEAGYAMTKGDSASGLFASTSDIYSNYLGATLLSKNVFEKEDQLAFSIKQPLRVVSGSAAMIISGVNEEGVATYQTESLGLKPDGREIDYILSYETPIANNQALGLQAAFRKDLQNISGEHDIAVGLTYQYNFY